MGDQLIGDGQDRFGRAVILLEADDLGVWVISLEIQDVGDVGAAPGVDGLVGIADDADVAMLHRQGVDEDILGVIGVLILVDENVFEAILKLGKDGRMLLHRTHGTLEEIIEIQGVGGGQELLIFPVNLGDDLRIPI